MQIETDLLERIEQLVEGSRDPLPLTAGPTAVIAKLFQRIEALEAALRELADALGRAGETEHPYAANERHSSDRLSDDLDGSAV
jgi:hypothetical protein